MRESMHRPFDAMFTALTVVVASEGWPISFSVGVIAFEGPVAQPQDATRARRQAHVRGQGLRPQRRALRGLPRPAAASGRRRRRRADERGPAERARHQPRASPGPRDAPTPTVAPMRRANPASRQPAAAPLAAGRTVPRARYASDSGSARSRLPVAAASALATAGAITGTPGSPTPDGLSVDGTMCTSTAGISLIRSSG